jgi:hypothetical protein
LCFSHLASWACFANVVVGYYGNVRSVVRHLVSRFSFPIRNLVTKCDLRCLVVWRFPNPIWKLDLGSVPAITALPILVGLTTERKFSSIQHASVGSKFSIRLVTSAHCVVLATTCGEGGAMPGPQIAGSLSMRFSQGHYCRVQGVFIEC